MIVEATYSPTPGGPCSISRRGRRDGGRIMGSGNGKPEARASQPLNSLIYS